MIQSATSKSDTAIRIRGLSKAYTIQKGGLEKQSTLAESALARLKNPLKRAQKETFHVLKDIDLDIKKGEVVGIIGRNGAGKSTLLKILSRITYPTTGQVDIFGRVGSLLEVGTGFHPELVGRENIYLNGAILGMTRPEITREFDAIVDFAGVEKFLDTPVKRYSSGMYVRLAFAVAAHLRTEILIVDEVLAVGDAEFQKKCLGKMQDVAEGEGRTVLFVSHQMQTIQSLCQRALYLQSGELVLSGTVGEAIERYVQSFERVTGKFKNRLPKKSADKPRIIDVQAAQESFACAAPKVIWVKIDNGVGDTSFHISCQIYDMAGIIVGHCDSRLNEIWVDTTDGRYTDAEITLTSPWLKPGSYRVEVLLCNAGIVDRVEDGCFFDVMPMLPYSFGGEEAIKNGIVLADFAYKVRATESCDLAAKSTINSPNGESRAS